MSAANISSALPYGLAVETPNWNPDLWKHSNGFNSRPVRVGEGLACSGQAPETLTPDSFNRKRQPRSQPRVVSGARRTTRSKHLCGPYKALRFS